MTTRVRMRVTFTGEYDANPDDYPDIRPEAMAECDLENLDIFEAVQACDGETIKFKIEPVPPEESEAE